MDRDALARAGRRAQAEEALEFERDREAELRRQVAELVLEEEGPRIDAVAFAALADDDVRRVRAALGDVYEDDAEDEDPFADEVFVELDVADDADDHVAEDEGSRLLREIEESLRTQEALERFIAALGDVPAAAEAR